MRIYYDTEFIEDGRTIDLVSIGMVADNGDEYYAISSEFDLKKFAASDWLMANVWPSLPQVRGDARMMILSSMREGASAYKHVKRLFSRGDPDVKPRRAIAEEVRGFIRSFPAPELWASYGAYDHVALAQLFGRMIDLPSGIPMWTNDLQQMAAWFGLTDDDLPQQEAGHHNALADARHNLVVAHFLDEQARRADPH